jgi:hypothetical protein
MIKEMIECDGIDKKKNKKCESPARYTVKIDNEIHYRCGRHTRNMDKQLIENIEIEEKEKKKRGRKPKLLKSDELDENRELEINKEKNEIGKEDIQEISHPKFNSNKDEQIKLLFTKIDRLCDLLNEKI